MNRILSQHNGKIVKLKGDCIKSCFPKTNNNTDYDAIKEVLECCLKLIESRNSISINESRRFP
jgi:class 3 adenylate cyclase